MTYQDMQNLLYDWLNDPNETYYTKVPYWINHAQRELQKKLLKANENWYAETVTTTLVPNYDTYPLPSDFLKVHKLEVVLSGFGTTSEERQTVFPMTPVQIENIVNQTGVPQAYYLKKNCFVLRPIPDSAYQIKVMYSYLVQDMVNATDVPDAPLQYHEYIPILAAYNGFLKDQLDVIPPAYIAKKTEYEEMLMQDAKNRSIDSPRQVIVTSGEAFDGIWI